MKHRAICFITVLALCLGLCPVQALAAGAERPSYSFTVTGDTTLYRTYDVTKPLVFDTDGYSYTISGRTALRVQSEGELYLTTGRIESTEGAGIEVLAGGFLCVDEPGMTVAGTTYGLDIASGARVRLSGGTFTGGSSAIHAQDGNYTALLETAGGTRYAYFDENGSPISLFDANGSQIMPEEVSGKTTVTVKECTDHMYAYTANPDVPNHNGVCEYCGAEVEAVPCTFSFDASGYAACKDGCGHTLDITINPDWAVYDGTEKPDGDPVTVTLDGDMGNGKGLTKDTHYTVACEALVDVGETLITVTGKTYNGTYQKIFSVTRARPGIAWANTGPVEADYNGSPVDKARLPGVTITAANESDKTDLEQYFYFSYKEEGSNADFTRGLPTDAGTYKIVAILPETANYHAARSAELTLTINKIDPIKEAPRALDLTYNGSAQKLVTPGAVWDGAVILFAASENGPWSTDVPTGTDAGLYEVWYTVEETRNYNNVIGNIFPGVTIERKPISPIVELEYYTCVYDGGVKQPKVTVRDNDNYWNPLPDTEYEVEYADNQGVGKATVTVKDRANGNYQVEETSVYFEITPADQDALTIINRPNKVIYGDVFTLGTSGGSGNGAVIWEIIAVKDGSGQDIESGNFDKIAVIDAGGQVTVKGVGTVTVQATKSDGDNHKDATAVWTFTAGKRPVTAAVTAEDKTYDGKATATVHAMVEQGVVSGDTIEITGLTGTFSDANAGTNKAVSVDTAGAVIKVNGDVIANSNSEPNEKYIVTIPGAATADIAKVVSRIVTLPEAKKDLVYNRTEQELLSKGAVPNNLKNIQIEYALSANGPWSTSIPKAADAGRYEVWYRAQESANYTGIPAAMVEATITSKPVVNPDITVTPGSIAYDGAEKKPAVTVKDGDDTIPASEYTVTYSNNINVGTATVTVTDKAGGNYTVNGTAAFTITMGGSAVLTGTPLANNLTYNGQAQELVTVGTADGGSLVYGLAEANGGEPTDYTSEIPKGTDAKEYKVYYKVKGDGNHADTEPAWVFVTIQPKTVSSPVITLPNKTFTYTGSAQKFEDNEITVKDGTDTIPASEYTVTYSNNVNAGTATVHIKDNNGGNYTVNGSTAFEIGKAAAGFATEPEARSLTYNGSAQTLITAGVPEGGTAVYWLDGGVPSTGLPTGTDSGEYTVWARVLGDANHKDSDPQEIQNVAIGKNTVANLTVELSSAVFRYNGGEQKPTVTVKDDKGYLIAANEYAVTYEGDTVNVTYGDDGTVSGYKVVINSKGVNYSFAEHKEMVKILPAEQTPLTITGKPSLVHYGDLFSLDTAGGSGDGAITWSTGNNGIAEINSNSGLVKVTDVGTVTITVTKAASTDGNYQEAFDTWTFTAVQAAAQWAAQPRPASGLTYTGSEQPLLAAGAATVNSIGSVEYSLTREGTYSANIPEGTNAGAYIVWYMVAGDASGRWKGIAPDYVEVTIGRKELDGRTLIIEWDKAADTADTPGLTVKDSEGNIIPSDEYTVKVTTDNWQTKTEFTVMVTAKENGNYKFETPYTNVQHEPNEGNIDGGEDSPGVSGGDGPSVEGGSSGGSSGSSRPSGSTNAPPAAAEPGRESASVQTSVRDGAASTVVNGAAVDELVDEAVANGSGAVVIRPEITGDVTKTEVSIPASAVGRLGGETDAALTVSTPVADVTIPNGALEALSGAGDTVGVVTERVENTVVLTLVADGRDVGEVPGGLTLTVSVEDAGPGTVAVILYEDGTRKTVRRSVADGGALRIPLNGSATVEIVDDNSKEFTDISPGSWASDAVTFASAHELFNGTGKTTFSPELAMSRGMLAVVLHNLESNPETAFHDVFADVENGAWYAEGVSWAADRGIVTGYGNGSFGAADPITREQLAVMLWRYAGSPAAAGNGLNFTDAGNTSGWALDAMSWAVENGIINGHGNGILDPGGPATRAQAAQMMKNFIENT